MGCDEFLFTMEALMQGLLVYVILHPVSIANACLKPGGMYFSLKDNKTL